MVELLIVALLYVFEVYPLIKLRQLILEDLKSADPQAGWPIRLV